MRGVPALQAGLSWWSVISPFSGYGSTAALVFVLAVAAVKAIWEDVKRHHEDKRMNTSITHRVNPDGALVCCCGSTAHPTLLPMGVLRGACSASKAWATLCITPGLACCAAAELLLLPAAAASVAEGTRGAA